MGVQSSEMIDSKLIMYVLCPSSLLVATRIWARSDDKKCTVKVHRYGATICATVGIVLRPTRRLSVPYSHKSCTVHTMSSVIIKLDYCIKLHYSFKCCILIICDVATDFTLCKQHPSEDDKDLFQILCISNASK
jgi:hypothetical protein